MIILVFHPFFIRFPFSVGIGDDGQVVVTAQVVAELPYIVVGLFAVMVFFMVNVISSAENYMVMYVSFINVCGHNIRIFILKKFLSKLVSYLMGFFIAYLSGEKRLDKMVSFIFVSPAGFGQGEFKIKRGCLGAASAGGNQDGIICFIRVAYVVYCFINGCCDSMDFCVCIFSGKMWF